MKKICSSDQKRPRSQWPVLTRKCVADLGSGLTPISPRLSLGSRLRARRLFDGWHSDGWLDFA